MKKRVVLVAAVTLVIVAFLGTRQAFQWWTQGSQTSQRTFGPGIALAASPELQNKPFVNVAGITTYTNVLDPVTRKPASLSQANLGTIAGKLARLEKQTDSYVLGTYQYSVWDPRERYSLQAYDISIYAEDSGFVAAYLPKGVPTSQMINGLYFYNPSESGYKPYSRLEKAIAFVASSTGYQAGDIRYYHFAYPQAAYLTLAGRNGGRPMVITVPHGVQFQEVSWFSIWGVSQFVVVDGSRAGTCGAPVFGDSLYYGLIKDTFFSSDKSHTFSIESDKGELPEGWGIVFVYSVQ